MKDVSVKSKASPGELQFVASVSHELRGPLHAILGLSELLLEANLRSDDKKLVSALNREASTLQTIIDDILDYARVSTGKLELVEKSFSIVRLVADMVETTRPSASQKELSLTFEVEPSVPQNVLGDQVRYGQVVRNLLTNAVRYTNSGSIKVSLGFSNEKIICKVSDTGVGIAEDNIERLFDPFEQANLEKGEGAGLGLAISQRLAQLMGGNISVESELGAGSEFSFSVALQESEEVEDAHVSSDASANSTGKILIVEDNQVNQMLAQNQLKVLGYTSDIVGDGETALQTISNEYALVLMDWNLPGIDGLETTRQIRAMDNISPELPIIAMTANALSGDKDKCLAAGMDDFLPKPVGINALGEMLNKWVVDVENVEVAEPKTESLNSNTLENLVSELGGKEVVVSLVEAFLGELPTQIETIKQVEAGVENVEAKRASHTLKSTAKLLGADTLALLCDELNRVEIADEATVQLSNQIVEEAKNIEVAFASYLEET